MRIRTPLILSFLIILAMLGASLWGWMNIAADARVAVHWGLNGKPNGFASRTFALFALPAGAVLLTALFAIIPAIEPRRDNLIASRKLYMTGWIAGVAILGFVHALIVLGATGSHVDIARFVLFAVAGLYMAVGNYLGKSRSNFFVGFRLPWTLSSELAWEKANRTSGRALVATGVTTVLLALLDSTTAGLCILLIGTCVAFFTGAVASFVYWKRDNGTSVHE